MIKSMPARRARRNAKSADFAGQLTADAANGAPLQNES
jgi:hypothetical protein